MSQTHQAQKDKFDLSMDHLIQYLQQYKRDNKDWKKVAGVMDTLAKLASAKDDPEKPFHHLELIVALAESVYNVRIENKDDPDLRLLPMPLYDLLLPFKYDDPSSNYSHNYGYLKETINAWIKSNEPSVQNDEQSDPIGDQTTESIDED